MYSILRSNAIAAVVIIFLIHTMCSSEPESKPCQAPRYGYISILVTLDLPLSPIISSPEPQEARSLALT